MKPRAPAISREEALRWRAEESFGIQLAKLEFASADAQRLVQELQIQQIELELQNEDLLHANAEVEAGLAKYTDLYDFAPVGYFTLSPQAVIQMVNLTGAGLAGTDRSRLVGRSFSMLLRSTQRAAFVGFLRKVFEGPVKQAGEFELCVREQPPKWVNIEAQCLPSGLGCRMAVTDITARKQAEDHLRTSEVRYRRLFEAAHDGVLLLDPLTRKITDANPFMIKLLGYSRPQLVGKELFEIGLLRDAAASRAMFEQLKVNRQLRYDYLPLETQDGRHREVEVVANLYAENGHTVIQCNIRDITVRKKAEEVLRRNEALFSALIEQAPVGVYVVDDEFRLQQVNPRAQRVFAGVHPLIGRDFAEVHRSIWTRRVSDPIVKLFRQTLKTGVPYKSPKFSEHRLDTGKEEIYEWQIQRVTLPAGEYGVVAFFNDITERTRAEAAQRRLDVLTATNVKMRREIMRRQVVESALRKSEQSGRLMLVEARQLQERLRHLSHQILLVQEQERKKISRELHDDISQVLVGIVMQLSNFARAAEVRPERIRKSIVPLQRLVEKSLEIVARFARELRPSLLDDFGLVPALQYYIDNFPDRRNLRIEFKATGRFNALDNDCRIVLYRVVQEALVNVRKHAQATVAQVTLHKRPGMVHLEIADNGKSFDVARLTSPKWNRRLGLIGMRERVEMFNGRFRIESIVGKGTKVRATMPLHKVKSQ
ncbi:PAS domain S-box protein [Oleiharenicola lentus]|uniref:PAS domain-containing sensor histidine kinase n=1 Tax=Oleiharenicola lentus TaxID=2508720 RepID=UPI003F67BA52